MTPSRFQSLHVRFPVPDIEELFQALVAKVTVLEDRLASLGLLETPSGGSGISAGLIAFHDAACPDGWVEYTAAQGRVVVGVPAGGTLAGTVGSALTNLASRTIATVATHLHAFGTLVNAAEAAHTHAVGTLANAAEAAHTHAVGTLANAADAAHTHPAGSYAADSTGAHQHTLGEGTAGGSSLQDPAITRITNNNRLSGSAGAHTHVVSGTSGVGSSHGHAISGATAAGASHNHAISGSSAAGASHNHAISGSVANTGTATVDVTMPYIQLMYCQKS